MTRQEAEANKADLRGADLRGAKNISPIVCSVLLSCPATGTFTGWKKLAGGLVARLTISGKRSSATGRKCRCDGAVVEEIFDSAGRNVETGVSMWDNSFRYAAGMVSVPSGFDGDRWNECGEGIHFFITREEAEEFLL